MGSFGVFAGPQKAFTGAKKPRPWPPVAIEIMGDSTKVLENKHTRKY